MVVVPPGRFAMRWVVGPNGRLDFRPDPNVPPAQKEVRFPTAFAAGVYDVTRGEYAAFVRDTHRPTNAGCSIHVEQHYDAFDDTAKNWLNPGFRQTEHDPVVCVSWNDAQAYVHWLNRRVSEAPTSGNTRVNGPYRLPTWEEAEYVASAGASTAYPWGDDVRRDEANYGSDKCLPCTPTAIGGDRWRFTSPVESFAPNGFGLHDAVGNVWQWTNTCISDDPSCRWMYVFGGSWHSDPEYIKLSQYTINDPINRDNTMGFRVVRSLDSQEFPLVVAGERDRPVPAGSNSGPKPGEVIQDCAHCPSMVVLPPGSIDLIPDGTLNLSPRVSAQIKPDAASSFPAGADDTRVHLKVDHLFAIGMYDVTRAEYAEFVRETGWHAGAGCQRLDAQGTWLMDMQLDWRNPGYTQTGRDPVVCVNVEDIRAYLEWLNGQLQGQRSAGDSSQGQGSYRLLSRVEWLYAARGGVMSPTAFYWGHVPSHDHAKYGLDMCPPCGLAKSGRDHWDYTAPAGSFPPNDFGLYDVVGNVWQILNDCPPDRGSVCKKWSLAGGSFDDEPYTERLDKLPTANDEFSPVRNYTWGFRVARSLE